MKESRCLLSHAEEQPDKCRLTADAGLLEKPREVGAGGLREIFVHSYRLIYQVEPTRVIILAVIHGKRELSAAWRQGDR